MSRETVDDLVAFVRGRDRDRWEVFAQQGSEPSPADVDALEARVGFRLPDDFRDFLLHPLGGLLLEAAEHLWPRPRALDVGPAWTFWYGVLVPSLSAEAPDFLGLEALRLRLVEDGAPPLVPCLKVVGDPDPWCYDAGGRLLRWRHDDPDDPEVEPDDLGFHGLLLREVRALDQRIDRLAAEHG